MKNIFLFTRKIFSRICLPFLAVFSIELVHIIYLIAVKRLVLHDAFCRLTVQYYLMNNAALYGEIPQWIPFMTHGTTAVYWFSLINVLGILNYVLIHVAGLFQDINFLVISYLGIFFDKILLLCGVWLLSRRFYSSVWTSFFVSVSVLGSSIWMSQTYFNLHLFYAIPLILYLFHKFLDTQKWRYCFLAANLFVVQSLGSLAYFLPVSSLCICLYILFYIIFNGKEFQEKIKKMQWGWPALFCFVGIAISFLGMYHVLKLSVNPEIVRFLSKRNSDGSVPLDIFLTYGGRLRLSQWIELFLGVAISKDRTLYIGIFPVALLLAGSVPSLNRKSLPFFLVAVVFLLISMGTFTASFFYYAWPLMKFYRHLCLLSPIVRLFLCFFAGFGFEAIFIRATKEDSRKIKRRCHVIGVMFLSLSMGLWVSSFDPKYFMPIAHLLSSSPKSQQIFLTDDVRPILSFLFRIAACKIFFVSIFMYVWPALNQKKCRNGLVVLFLVFQVIDIYTYAYRETKKKTVPLNAEQYQTMYFQRLPYRRSRREWKKGRNPREALISSYKLFRQSSQYWTLDAFFFNDLVDSPPLRTEYWQRPFNNYLKAYSGQSLRDPLEPPKNVKNNILIFPRERISAKKFSGIEEDKIQFFSHAYVFDNESLMAERMTSPQYQGNILLLFSPSKIFVRGEGADLWSEENSLIKNERIRLPYKVLHFSSNHLEVSVDVPLKEPIWLFYSDTWHPHWEARVNGRPAEIYRANLAYKAVQLKPGHNKVHFSFYSKQFAALLRILGLNALFWVGYISCLTGRICFPLLKKIDK